MREEPEVLVVGAGPTGLTLAAVLQAHGSRVRIVDRNPDRAHESRALVIQSRSLELFQLLGLAEPLIQKGQKAIRACLHARGRVAAGIELGSTGAQDTRFPFVLFLSQAETERILNEHLASVGIAVERGIELADYRAEENGVTARLIRSGGGDQESVHAGYLVGCDGAHSAVRRLTGIRFEGDEYPQEFLLGDLDVQGSLEPNALHIYLASRGFLAFFPLGHPAPWRLIAASGHSRDGGHANGEDLRLDELQRAVDAAAGEALVLRDPVWLARFQLHHRQARRYRSGRVFLAGDAAHIHSPAGGQGMNTGIQDAWNLAWKLGLVARSAAADALLDSYHAERWPVGRFLMRFTDRVFSVGTSTNPLARFARTRIVPWIVPPLAATDWGRRRLFRTVSQLGIRYGESPIVAEGEPRLTRGPKAGDRLPDARIERNGKTAWLQDVLSRPAHHLFLCGDASAWNENEISRMREHWNALLVVHRLCRRSATGDLQDVQGEAFERLGVETSAQYLVRPDGHIAFRCAGSSLAEAEGFLRQWFPVGGTNPS
jgi:2-polyprenyl-6-methoxyphenol hydroxylase-like FAD-dependent oxidoreductase